MNVDTDDTLISNYYFFFRKVPMAFDSHYGAPLKLTHEAEEYGSLFVHEWMGSGAFARSIHRADHLYIAAGGAEPILKHPSGPPSDQLDQIADAYAESLKDFAEARERAKQKLSQFWGPSPDVPPVAPADGPPPPPSALDELQSKAKKWWSSFTNPVVPAVSQQEGKEGKEEDEDK